MKKFLIASGVAVLAFASLAGAQGYTFNTNLTIGSTGADVVALQTALINAGFDIPAITSGAAAKGYFGAQTQSAVKAYQAAHGIPNTGFFGPLTRAAMNAGGVATVPTTPGVIACPVGFVCTPVGGTPTTGTPTGISTVGVPGTLTVSLQTTYNNSVLDKGKSADIARFRLQASASDMQVSSLSLDFSDRLWLYASAITIKDDSGNVIASKSGLSASDFAELTTGTNYRLTVPMTYVVPASAVRYLTVNITALTISDRGDKDISLNGYQVRAVDGTGVTVTESVTSGITHKFEYESTGDAEITATINSSSPATGLVQISTSVETDNVVLGVFDIRSKNSDSTLRTLKVYVNADTAINTLFPDIKVRIGGTTYSADTISVTAPDSAASSTVTFNNLNITLPRDQYVPVTVLARVAKNVSGTASTTLVANETNIVAEDMTYNDVDVVAGAITANEQTFTTTGVNVTSLATSYGTKSTISDTGSTTQSFTWSFTLKAGESPIYVSKNVYTALSTSTNPNGFTIINQDFSVDNTSGDGTTYFYIAPGMSKTFTAQYQASALLTNAGNISVTAINFGTDTTATGGSLNASEISNGLKAVLWK